MSAAQAKLSIPSDKTLQQATKLSIKLCKPICFYFYIDSCRGRVNIVQTGGDKIIYKKFRRTYFSNNKYI